MRRRRLGMRGGGARSALRAGYPSRDEVRLGSLTCGAAGLRRGHGRQGGLAGRTGSPQSQTGVGPPRQRPGVADLVGGHHEGVERRSRGAPGPPPGGRGGEAPGRSSGLVGRRPARCRWKRNPPRAPRPTPRARRPPLRGQDDGRVRHGVRRRWRPRGRPAREGARRVPGGPAEETPHCAARVCGCSPDTTASRCSPAFGPSG